MTPESRVNRRHWRRLALSAPVQLHRGPRLSRADAPRTADARTISPGGLYVTTRDPFVYEPGEILAVSLSIPQETRRAFPFSRVAAACRVVRIDPLEGTEPPGDVGLALAFCEDGSTMLGATRNGQADGHAVCQNV